MSIPINFLDTVRWFYNIISLFSEVDPVADRLVNWLPFVLEHLNYFINRFHSSVVDLGPRVFMGCPLQLPANEIESWFINLWNHFVIPYLMGAVLAGIEVCVCVYIVYM